MRLFALSSNCRRSSSTRIFILPSIGLYALPWIETSRGLNDSFGSTGRRASITKSVISIPVGICQEASLIVFGFNDASKIPPTRLGGLSAKLFCLPRSPLPLQSSTLVWVSITAI